MIYFKSDKKFRTRKELLRHFIRYVNTTYHNVECTEVQCENGKNRSITDLHLICKSVFPNTSLKAVVRIIKELIDEDTSIGLIWCTVIRKVVIMKNPYNMQDYITSYSRTNYYESEGVDGYSLKDFENIIKDLN